jgi:hypothetical protein
MNQKFVPKSAESRKRMHESAMNRRNELVPRLDKVRNMEPKMRWIYNATTDCACRISLDEAVPQGFHLGRRPQEIKEECY